MLFGFCIGVLKYPNVFYLKSYSTGFIPKFNKQNIKIMLKITGLRDYSEYINILQVVTCNVKYEINIGEGAKYELLSFI